MLEREPGHDLTRLARSVLFLTAELVEQFSPLNDDDALSELWWNRVRHMVALPDR